MHSLQRQVWQVEPRHAWLLSRPQRPCVRQGPVRAGRDRPQATRNIHPRRLYSAALRTTIPCVPRSRPGGARPPFSSRRSALRQSPSRFTWSSNRVCAASSASPPIPSAAMRPSSSRSITSSPSRRSPTARRRCWCSVPPPATGWPRASPLPSAAMPPRWVCSSSARVPRPSPALLAGTTPPRSTSTPGRPACTPRASMAMPSPMRSRRRSSS
ncbi:hypothetical protein D3C71_1370720 [compost metagenome]